MEGSCALNEESRRAAFARYVVPEIEVVLRVARTLVGRPADAEDLVQDTLVRAFRAIDGFDGAHPRAWLLTILRNTNINRNRRRRPALLDNPDEADGSPSSYQVSPEDLVVGEAFDDVVMDALGSLSERYRQVVQLIDLDGLSYAEAADVVGVPIGTIMSRLHRARAKIRKRLASAGLTPGRRAE